MEVIYSKACGVDVHKSFIVAVICDSTSITPKYLRKRFSTFNNDLIRFKDWLLDNDCSNVCMESTGKYYVPVYNALEGHISNVVVANPKWVKAIKGQKDDNKDAKWIADLFKMGLVRSSYIPSKDFRILREFTRYRYKLTNTKTSEKNRFTNALTVGNCKVDMVFSDIFGKSSQSIINIILNNDNFSDDDIINCVSKKCKSTHEDILSSVAGIQFTNEQKLRINIVKDHIDYLINQINNLNNIIDTLVAPYESYIDLLSTIPGFDRNSAIAVLSEISNDVSQFKSHYRLTSWAGLAPGCNESAGKKKSVRITRAGVYLKPALVQCAHAAVKSDKSPYYKKKYESLVKRRGKKRAIIAISRMILTAIYQMLSTGEQWNPSVLYKIDMLVALVEKQKAKAIKQAKKLLQREGILPPDEPLVS